MVPSDYTNFFVTAATAGAALIGLLFVAISLAPERTVQAHAPIEARIVSGSTFTGLFNGFFISLGALLPGTNIGWIALPLSIVGVANTVNQWRALLNPWPSWQNVLRRTWLALASLCLFIIEMVYSIELLISPTNRQFVFYIGLSVFIIYSIALIRAWELLGVQRGGLLGWLNPLYDMNKKDEIVTNHDLDTNK